MAISRIGSAHRKTVNHERIHVKSFSFFCLFVVYLCCDLCVRAMRSRSLKSIMLALSVVNQISQCFGNTPTSRVLSVCFSHRELSSMVHSHIANLELDSRGAETGSPSPLLHCVPFLWIVEIFFVSHRYVVVGFPQQKDSFRQ